MSSMDKIMLKLGYIKKERYIKERNRFKKLHKENQLLIARINQLEEEKQDLLRGLTLMIFTYVFIIVNSNNVYAQV